MYQQIIELQQIIGNLNGDKVLDIGTGQGDFLKTLLENLNKYEIAFGYDISKKSLEAAKINLKDQNVNFILGDGKQLPFLDNEFDLITISNSLHHFDNIDNMISEAIRVLKVNGILLINEMISNNLTEPQLTQMKYHHLAAKIDKLLGGYHNFTYTDKEIKEFFINNSRINLVEEYIHEEKKIDFINEEEIQSVNRVIDNKLNSILTLPEYEELVEESKEIKARASKVGMEEPKQVLLLYKKLN